MRWKAATLLALLLAGGLAIWLWQSVPVSPVSTLVGLDPALQVKPIFVEPPPVLPPPTPPEWHGKLAEGPIAKTKAECARVNGLWVKRASMGTAWMCFTRTHDAGKACTDHAQCEAFCRAPKPVSAGTPVAGVCNEFFEIENTCPQGVSDGKAEVKWCID